MREKRTDSGKVLEYSGAQEEVVPVGSSQPQRPQVFLNITPLVKHGNALYVSCISCLMLLGRCILSSKRACLPGWITVRGAEWRHSFNKNETVCMHVTPKSLKKWPHTERYIYIYICVNCVHISGEN